MKTCMGGRWKNLFYANSGGAGYFTLFLLLQKDQPGNMNSLKGSSLESVLRFTIKARYNHITILIGHQKN